MEIENIFNEHTISDTDIAKISAIIQIVYQKFTSNEITSRDKIVKFIGKLGRERKIIPSIPNIQRVYRLMVTKNEIPNNKQFEDLFRTKVIRSISGVVVITVFTSPYPETLSGVQRFSCKYNCFYCPQEPDQPRSYLTKEPAVARANQCHFDSKEQFYERSKAYIEMGHPLDKIGLIVSGGTFTSYPREYIVNFFRDQFYAANTVVDKFDGKDLRQPLSLYEEQIINQNTSDVKIIGITIETRPDQINKDEMIFFRTLGVTRVQIGVQHIDDRILTYINRGCTNQDTINAIKMLKTASFKVDVHIMPDLPHPESITQQEMIDLDRDMFRQIIEKPDYQSDQYKIYPCTIVPYTKIKEWHENGSYQPYANIHEDGTNPLVELLVNVKSHVKPWVRINRVIRDFLLEHIISGNNVTSLRDVIQNEMRKRKIICNCIRCREIKNKDVKIDEFKLIIRQYDASDGDEFFISFENDHNIIGMLRLRINKNFINEYFPELSGCAMIRELHVYGQMLNHDDINNGGSVQHLGIGKMLLNESINITRRHGLNKISVISGIGVRNYYIKQGFKLCETYNNEQVHGGFLIRQLPTFTIL
jgi:ELP3 family radical SAM enzyme/protein acetyltransferase